MLQKRKKSTILGATGWERWSTWNCARNWDLKILLNSTSTNQNFSERKRCMKFSGILRYKRTTQSRSENQIYSIHLSIYLFFFFFFFFVSLSLTHTLSLSLLFLEEFTREVNAADIKQKRVIRWHKNLLLKGIILLIDNNERIKRFTIMIKHLNLSCIWSD